MDSMTYLRYRLSYQKEIYYILCIVVVLLILLFSIFGPGGYRELQKTRAELRAQNRRVEELKRKNEERMRKIEALRSDKDALENYAREKGYGREGEIIQQLQK
jgi:cell division protein FtsB